MSTTTYFVQKRSAPAASFDEIQHDDTSASYLSLHSAPPQTRGVKIPNETICLINVFALGLHYSLNHPDDGDDGSSSDRSGASYVTRDGMTRTSNSLFTAALRQHERESMTTAGVVVVECIAMAVASVCGNAGAKVSPARRRAHKIVEMLRWQQWTGEYGGVDGDPGSSDGSASWRRRRA